MSCRDVRAYRLTSFIFMKDLFFIEFFIKKPGLYAAFGVLIVAGALVIWLNYEQFIKFVTTDINIRILGLVFLTGVLLYISQRFFVMRIIKTSVVFIGCI